MARMTIEECWWTDPRRSALIRLVGDEGKADSCAIRAWRLAQEFWKQDRQLIPKHIFDILEGAAELVRTGLADVRESFVYVRGSSAYLDWVREKREVARAAGKKSALARRAKSGSAQPKPRASPELTPNESRTKLNVAEPSVSVFDSVSGSEANTENNTTCMGELTLAPSPTLPVPKKSRFDEETRNKMRSFIATYSSFYREKYGGPPEGIRQPEVVGKIGNWIKTVSEDRANQLAQVYLQIDYRPITESCHDLWQFFRHLNRIGNALSTGKDPNQINWASVFGGAA